MGNLEVETLNNFRKVAQVNPRLALYLAGSFKGLLRLIALMMLENETEYYFTYSIKPGFFYNLWYDFLGALVIKYLRWVIKTHPKLDLHERDLLVIRYYPYRILNLKEWEDSISRFYND